MKIPKFQPRKLIISFSNETAFEPEPVNHPIGILNQDNLKHSF